jgi:hypothetical protein
MREGRKVIGAGLRWNGVDGRNKGKVTRERAEWWSAARTKMIGGASMKIWSSSH